MKPEGEHFIPYIYCYIICGHVLSNLYHCFLATLYLSELSLVNCLALVQVPASSALHVHVYDIQSLVGL